MTASRAVAIGVAGLLAAGAMAVAATPPSAIDSLDSPANVGSIDWAAPAERPAVPTATERRPGAGERVPTGNPLWALPLRTLSVTRERPIFSPSRRPPAPPVVAAPAAPPPPPPAARPAEPDHPLLSILGTVVGDRESIGVFMEESTRNVVRLRTGEEYDGWVLKAVEGRDARFEKNERTATLSLTPPDGSQVAPPMLAGAASVPAGIPSAPLPPTPAALAQSPAAAAPGATWMDGDGQMIAPPPRRSSQQSPTPIPTAAPAPPMPRPVRREN